MRVTKLTGAKLRIVCGLWFVVCGLWFEEVWGLERFGVLGLERFVV
jgi:hypothetical protein